MKKRIREESGSVTIEATISLSAFMFTIVTLLTIVNICLVQAKISVAINSTAKELSHYSYMYSLTGIPGSKAELVKKADGTAQDVNSVLSKANTVFTEIQNIGNATRVESTDISGMLSDIETSYNNASSAGGALKEQLMELSKDPKGVAMGLAKMAAVDGWDFATSRLIAAPLAKGLCKKNLVAEKNGDVESYLRGLGVVPSSNGSYYDGLDFSKSTLFPSDSNEIRITVSYDVKVIALLPIDFSFHFTQTAVTHGWLCGENSYRSTTEALDVQNNSNIWTEGTIQERVELMRHQGIAEYKDQGYLQVAGASFSDVHVYNETTKEFVAFHSMNPLYSAPGSDTLTLDDISETAIKESIEYLCAGINDSTKDLETVKTKPTSAQDCVKDCKDSTCKIVLVIPQDKDLDAKMQSIIDKCNTRGVTIELMPAYGNGARTTTVAPDEGEAPEEGGETEK